MAQFRFSLDGVLRQRAQAERQKQRDLAQVRARLAALEQELRAMDEQREATDAQFRDQHLVGKLDLSFIAAHRRYSIAVERKAVDHAGQMAVVQKQADEAQAALAEAAKQRKVLEKLREKQLERWRAEQSRKEIDALDEVAMQMSTRAAFDAEDGAVSNDGGPVHDGGDADDGGAYDRPGTGAR